MAKRKIIEIDRDKCNRCGLCTDACAEGALALDEENKAVLAREIYCDGLGACFDVCPTDALKIIERESDLYEPKATYDHVLEMCGKDATMNVLGIEKEQEEKMSKNKPVEHQTHMGCPGSMAREIPQKPSGDSGKTVSSDSELSQWPIQLHLVSPYAPYFNESDLLIAADCTAQRMLIPAKALVHELPICSS